MQTSATTSSSTRFTIGPWQRGHAPLVFVSAGGFGDGEATSPRARAGAKGTVFFVPHVHCTLPPGKTFAISIAAPHELQFMAPQANRSTARRSTEIAARPHVIGFTSDA